MVRWPTFLLDALRAGVNGLQSVVLYALPELDGAIDATPLGALIREDVIVVEERLEKVIRRMKAWIKLRKSAAKDKRIAIMLYGFPPNVGAVGTAALLNVPKSLESLLCSLADSGYDLGEMGRRVSIVEPSSLSPSPSPSPSSCWPTRAFFSLFLFCSSQARTSLRLENR